MVHLIFQWFKPGLKRVIQHHHFGLVVGRNGRPRLRDMVQEIPGSCVSVMWVCRNVIGTTHQIDGGMF